MPKIGWKVKLVLSIINYFIYALLIITMFEYFFGMKIYRERDFTPFIIISSLMFESIYLVLNLLISKYTNKYLCGYVIASILSPIICICGLMIDATYRQ